MMERVDGGSMEECVGLFDWRAAHGRSRVYEKASQIADTVGADAVTDLLFVEDFEDRLGLKLVQQRKFEASGPSDLRAGRSSSPRRTV